jgi:hypothetical protein
MNSSRAVERAVKALRYGGRFVTAGGKRARGWRGILINPITFVVSLPFVTHLSETKCPWKNVEASLGPLNIEEHLWGSAYIGYAVKRANVVSKSGV